MTPLTLNELLVLGGEARRRFLETPAEGRLSDMKESLSPGERVCLSHLHAAIMLLNKRQLLVPGWENSISLELTYEDSDPNPDE